MSHPFRIYVLFFGVLLMFLMDVLKSILPRIKEVYIYKFILYCYTGTYKSQKKQETIADTSKAETRYVSLYDSHAKYVLFNSAL